VPDVVLLEPADAAELQPLLRPDRIELALLEPGAMAIDVHALHQLYLHRLRERGGQVATTARVTSAEREGERWQVSDAAGRTWSADVVVNAAGAWADQIAALFGAGGAGLAPMRRTAFMVDAPPDARAPMVADIDDAFYFRPDAGRLLCSPADETPSEPIDARPDELEIARAIEVINDVTRLDVRHVRSAWAGLRTFVPDRAPLVGYDDAVDGLFWYAAQGGYGIQMAAALARTGAALLRGAGVPDDVAARGLAATDIAPRRNAGAAAGG
jgi:D-arginine dehydrogenase